MGAVVLYKIFHYLALFLAGGLGVANGLLAKNHQKAELTPSPPVQKTMMTLARLGLFAIIILWITGFGLTYELYGSFSLGWAFHMKLFGATLLLLAISFLNYHLIQSAKNAMPPNPKVMKLIPILARGSLALVLIGIAIVTSS